MLAIIDRSRYTPFFLAADSNVRCGSFGDDNEVDIFHYNFTETSQFQVFCRVTWDTLLCWPPTRPGQTVHLPCPPRQGIDPTRTYQKLNSLLFPVARSHPIFDPTLQRSVRNRLVLSASRRTCRLQLLQTIRIEYTSVWLNSSAYGSL